MTILPQNSREWWKDATIYQIYPRSFRDSNGDGVGDLRGILEKIDYLDYLGVDALWLNPIYDSPNADWGYDVSDYRSIHPELGTFEEFYALLQELHRRDMRLIMDLVANHTSTEHAWFRSSLTDPSGPTGNFYIWKPGREDGPPNNWHSFFGGPAWEFAEERAEYYLHIFATGQADLNWENPAVREAIYEVIDWWFDRGVDGFRMDVINMISKDQQFPDDTRDLRPPATRGTPYFVNGPRLPEFLKEMRSRALSRPGITAIGECPGASVPEVKELANLNGQALDMVIQMDLMEIDHGAGGKWEIVPPRPELIADNIARWQEELQDVAWPANFFSNHDQPRAVSRFGDDREHRFESATMLATLLIAQTGTPFIYYGEEIGMPNADYEDIGHYLDVDSRNFYGLQTVAGRDEAAVMQTIRYMSRDNARSPMQWSGDRFGGFSTVTPWIPMGRRSAEVSVEADRQREKPIIEEYRKLLALRKAEPLLRRGRFARIETGNGGLLAFLKTPPIHGSAPAAAGDTLESGLEGDDSSAGSLLIVANLTAEELGFSPAERMARSYVQLYSNYRFGEVPRRLAPYEAGIYRLYGRDK